MLEIGTVSMNCHGQKLLLEMEIPYQLKGSWVFLLRCSEMVSIILIIDNIRRYLFTMLISLFHLLVVVVININIVSCKCCKVFNLSLII